MNTHRSGIWQLLMLLILLGVGIALAVKSVLAAPINPKINWTKCFQEYGRFECGTVQVPLDYGNPDEAAISIAVIRLPASDQAKKIGSLFLNPGGPGGSGIDFAVMVASFIYTPEVRERFDIVGFDPRGIGRSTGLRCFGNSKQWSGYLTNFAFPITPEQDIAWHNADLYLDNACEQRGSRIIDHMSTADVARDLDVLRQVVGDSGLTYAGYSYGTFLGVTYANLFPDKVRAIVIDGVLDPIAWTLGEAGQQNLPFSTRLRSDAGAMDALSEFFRLCDLYPINCEFSNHSAQRFASLATRLRANPLVIMLGDGTLFTFSYQDLIALTLSGMYNSDYWPELANLLDAIDGMMPAKIVGNMLEKFWSDIGYDYKRDFPNYQNIVEGFPGVACSDSDNPADYSAWWQAAQASEAQYGYFGSIWTYSSSTCSDWPGIQNDRYTGPFTNWTANPVLVVGMKHDPATRYQSAVKVHNLLPNSGLLTVEGWAHCSLLMSTPADIAVGEYLIDPSDLPDGEVYNQDWTPFEYPAFIFNESGKMSARQSLDQALIRIHIMNHFDKTIKQIWIPALLKDLIPPPPF